jgi:hypothetical protein
MISAAVLDAVLDALLAAGATAEQIAAVVKADAVEQESRKAAKRTNDAERQRRHRARNGKKPLTVTPCHAKSRGHSVTSRDTSSTASRDAIGPRSLDLFEPLVTPAKTIDPMPEDILSPMEDPKTRLWREGRTILIGRGIAERQASSLLGKWLKDVEGDAVGLLEALRSSERVSIIGSPIAYLTNLIKGRTNNGTSKRSRAPEPFGEIGSEMADKLRAAGH